jgi:hypothetical protein
MVYICCLLRLVHNLPYHLSYRGHQKPNTSGIQFHPGGGEFCPGWKILPREREREWHLNFFNVKMSNPLSLPPPPPLGVNIDRCIFSTALDQPYMHYPVCYFSNQWSSPWLIALFSVEVYFGIISLLDIRDHIGNLIKWHIATTT